MDVPTNREPRWQGSRLLLGLETWSRRLPGCRHTGEVQDVLPLIWKEPAETWGPQLGLTVAWTSNQHDQPQAAPPGGYLLRWAASHTHRQRRQADQFAGHGM